MSVVREFFRDAIIVASGARLLGMLDDAKIARHYRDIGRHPSFQTYGKRVGSPVAAYTRALYQGTPLAVLSVPAIAVVGMVSATHHYPQVAGPQFQSAISGQPSIGGDIYTLASPTVGSRKGYKFYELGYWRGY